MSSSSLSYIFFKDVLLLDELQAATPHIKNSPYFMEISHLRFSLVIVVSCGLMVGTMMLVADLADFLKSSVNKSK